MSARLTMLKRFCGHKSWDSRKHLCKPFRIGESVYATNGHLIVRVPAAGLDCPELGDSLAEFRGKVIDCFARDATDAFEPLPPLAQRVDCWLCGGCGVFGPDTRRAPCYECWGTGIEPRDLQTIGDAAFALRYLHLISTLPGLVFCARGAKEPAPFRFDGGDGLLMPARKIEVEP